MILFQRKKASGDWESKYADKLEKAIQKCAININFKVCKLNFESLEQLKNKPAELKIELAVHRLRLWMAHYTASVPLLEVVNLEARCDKSSLAF